jgi:CHAD domain-containing protein
MQSPYRYINILLNAVGKILLKGSDRISEGDLHDLRVNIKKINAHAKLIGKVRIMQHDKPDLKNTGRIFKKAGEIRELQLVIKYLVSKVSTSRNERLIAFIQNELNTSYDEFRLIRKKCHRSSLKEISVVRDSLKVVGEEEVFSFLYTELKKVEKIIKPKKVKGCDLHKLRKKLKVILYIYESSGNKPNGNEMYSQIKKATHLLGNWHDLIVQVVFLKHILKENHFKNSENEDLKKIIERIKRKRDSEFERVVSMLKGWKILLQEKVDHPGQLL